MPKRQKKKRPTSQWQAPPHASKAQESAAWWARKREFEARPPFPELKVILGALSISLLAFGMFLALLIPSKTITDDLGARGVTTASLITGVDNKPKYVKVQFDGPGGVVRTELSEFAGMLPAATVGESLTVVYDPRDPSRVLPLSWVDNPPFTTLPILGTAALTLICVALTAAVILRRCWYLRKFGRPPPSSTKSRLEEAVENREENQGVRLDNS
ncbi:hypothetical protein [Streptomyces phaeochromogenes]|uniref:hypothetical protein n=1 Tax=Streptomyces phaeochromogenes TaxID=1923 RepID=UPI0033DFF0AF